MPSLDEWIAASSETIARHQDITLAEPLHGTNGADSGIGHLECGLFFLSYLFCSYLFFSYFLKMFLLWKIHLVLEMEEIGWRLILVIILIRLD